MPKLRNEELWLEIENQPPFTSEFENHVEYHSAWEYLEKLQKSNKLSQIEILQLYGLVNNVFKLGQLSRGIGHE